MDNEFEYELRPITGYEGKYSVSNTGQVFSHNYLRTGQTRQLKPGKTHDGYLKVDLSRDGKRKSYKVHRLTLETFKPNHDSTLECDHIDGNRTNNHISNLRWVTHKENCNNPITLKNISKATKGENHPCYDATIYKFRNRTTNEEFIGTMFDFYTKYNLAQGHISRLVNGKLKSVKGWVLVECLTSS